MKVCEHHVHFATMTPLPTLCHDVRRRSLANSIAEDIIPFSTTFVANTVAIVTAVSHVSLAVLTITWYFTRTTFIPKVLVHARWVGETVGKETIRSIGAKGAAVMTWMEVPWMAILACAKEADRMRETFRDCAVLFHCASFPWLAILACAIETDRMHEAFGDCAVVFRRAAFTRRKRPWALAYLG